MAITINNEVKETIRKIRKLAGLFPKKEIQKILKSSAKPLVQAAKSNIADSDDIHFRYKPNKGGKKAAKGEGTIVAAYHPGNLRKSIKVLKFRKSNAVFVGPFVQKGNSGGIFSGGRTDGYYAAMVEFGTRHSAGQAYMRRAASSTAGIVSKNIVNGVKKKIDNYGRKNKI